MKRISTYIVTLVLALAGSSCSDYLDKEYDASLSEKKVFNNQNLTREFLANIYTNLPDGLAPLSDDQFTGASRDCMTDNAVTCWGLHYYTKIGSDGYTAGDHPLLGFWNTDLYGIRKCNMFLKNAKASVVGNTEKDGDDNRLYDRYCAEARLLRAIFHFDLICWFGAAPVIAEDESGEPIIFDLSDPSAMNMSRTPAAEALEWVADQCDQIKNQLPFRYSDEASNWGRVIRTATPHTGRMRHRQQPTSSLRITSKVILTDCTIREIRRMTITNVSRPIRYTTMKLSLHAPYGIPIR